MKRSDNAYFFLISILLLSVTVTLLGCNRDDANVLRTVFGVISSNLAESFVVSWDEKHQWKAEDYFDDPNVVALCKAIEVKDLRTIDRLIADGADVNARGKGNMTPLLWAFPENRPEVFKRLLEHGADPNVVVMSDFNTQGRKIQPGDSVLYLATISEFPNYFKYVMQHGGDPNLITRQFSPLMMLIGGGFCPDKKEAVQLLIDAGADLNYRTDTNERALCTSVSAGLFSITLQLLEAGADFNFLKEGGSTFVHFLLSSRERVWSITTLEDREYYDKVLEWLKTNGTDLEGARKDNR